MEMVNGNILVNVTDINGNTVTGEVIGTALRHAIVKYGEDRLDITTVSLDSIEKLIKGN